MYRLAASVLAIAAIGCGTSTTRPDVPQPSASPVQANEFQLQTPGDYRVPGTTLPPSPAIGAGGGGGSGQSGSGEPHCTDSAPNVSCGQATAHCTSGTYTCAVTLSAACTSSAVKCVYCPGPLCNSN